VGNDDEWARFAEAIGEPWTADSRFASHANRLQHQDELDEFVGKWTRTKTPIEVEQSLRSRRLAVSRLLDGHSQSACEPMHASGFYSAIAQPVVGVRWYTGLPFKLDGQRPVARRAPVLGEHSEYVFYTMLGMGAAEVSALTRDGVIGT
jgi:crotonobetainyl-CoA:carnitine CoA-transferase CaiB-like acyl-CoA transferase